MDLFSKYCLQKPKNKVMFPSTEVSVNLFVASLFYALAKEKNRGGFIMGFFSYMTLNIPLNYPKSTLEFLREKIQKLKNFEFSNNLGYFAMNSIPSIQEKC